MGGIFCFLVELETLDTVQLLNRSFPIPSSTMFHLVLEGTAVVVISGKNIVLNFGFWVFFGLFWPRDYQNRVRDVK